MNPQSTHFVFTPPSPLAAVEIGGKENFFFSLSTVDLRDVSGEDFETDFFLAYDQFNSLFVELVSALVLLSCLKS